MMEFIKIQENTDRFSRLIPKTCELIEETVIAILILEIKIKRVLCNTIRELPVKIEELETKQK